MHILFTRITRFRIRESILMMGNIYVTGIYMYTYVHVHNNILKIQITYLIFFPESFCPQSDNQPSSLHYEEFKLLEQQRKELTQFEQQLNLKEQELKRQFPDQIDSISDLHSTHLTTIYAITPTYSRPVQKAELTRLINTFINIRNFHWILVEDAATTSKLVSELLKTSGLKYTHLSQPTPPDYKMQPKDPNWLKPRGVLQRNKGLSWLRQNIDPDRLVEGVVYFADDDNTYSLPLFEEVSGLH